MHSKSNKNNIYKRISCSLMIEKEMPSLSWIYEYVKDLDQYAFYSQT